ncbi:MAG: methylated-DNA--[protein]-cysteine S-methyltransferase, partial [Woeseia sp.]
MYYCYLTTPIGDLLLAGNEDGLGVIGFPQGKMRRDPEPEWIFSEQPFAEARRQLGEYFDGKRQTFDLTLCPTGTEFQLAVLNELRKIPYGTTASYADIARRIGRPKAVRAVGAANGRNPLPVVIPCHRVIGSGGQL